MEKASLSTHANGAPSLSVVVVSRNTPGTLANCLASLSRQSAIEILVVDASHEDPAASLRGRFSNVDFLHFHPNFTVPELRREGINAAKGEIIALTESWMTPSEGWVDALRAAHSKFPEAPAIGGPISFDCRERTASALEWADYFSEYGAQVPEASSAKEVCRPCESLSGANVSYKQWALERCRDLVTQGAWEAPIHDCLHRAGFELMSASDAQVCYRRTVKPLEILQQRFSHGRGHAAERLRDVSRAARWARGAAAPLVPWLMFWRLARRVPPDLSQQFWASAAWILALYWSWAAGEAIGSWFGPERRN